MDNIETTKKLALVLMGIFVSFIGLYLARNYIVDKVADRVVEKIKRDYCPSPYGPGIDPDMIDTQKVLEGKANDKWTENWNEES